MKYKIKVASSDKYSSEVWEGYTTVFGIFKKTRIVFWGTLPACYAYVQCKHENLILEEDEHSI